MTTLQEVKPRLDEALQYLKTSDDFATQDAWTAFNTLVECWDDEEHMKDKAAYLHENGFGQLFAKIWNGLSGYLEKDKWGQDGLQILQVMLKSYNQYGAFCPGLSAEIGKQGIHLILAALGKLEIYFEDEEARAPVDNILSNLFLIVYNSVSRCKSNYTIAREANAVAVFQKYLKSEDLAFSTVSLMILAYITDESESGILASEGGVTMLADLLKFRVESSDHSSVGFSAKEILECMNRAAINDNNKQVIEKEGGVPTIVRMLQDDFDEEEQCVAAEALWNLAFIESIRKSSELQAALPCK